MRLALVLLALSLPALARSPGKHTQDYHQGANASGSASQSLLLLSPGQVAVSPLPCTAAGQINLLSGSYACLNGDGTQSSSSGMTLSAVGSPTTQTMEWAPNGSNNEPVSRKRWTASDSYQSASQSAPSGDFSVCHVGMVDAPLSAVTLVSGPGYSLSVTSAGVATFTSGGSSVSSASGAVVGGADQVICGTRSGTSGTVSVGGVRTSGTVAAPSGSAVLKVGGFVGATRGAFVSGHLLTQADETRLVAALVPVPQTATGQLVSNSRNSATWVTTSGGALVALPPGRTGVVGPPGETGVVGGVVSSPARTNLLTWSEDFSSAWVVGGVVSATTNTSVAPDGSLTADTLSATGATGGTNFLRQSVTANGGAYIFSAWGKAGTSAAGVLKIFDSTLSSVLCTSSAASGSTLTRLSCSVASTTSGDTLLAIVYPAGATANANGSSVWWGAQLETGSLASPYCRSEGTSATCAGDVVTVPTPSWLSTREGCAKVCVTPTWTGANPTTTLFVLNANSTNTARLMQVFGSNTVMGAYDGTNSPNVSASFVAGVRACYVTRWSASGGYFRVDNLTAGTQGAPSAFSGFPSFDSTLSIGANGGGTAQPLGSIIDSITLGSTPGGCR